MKFGQPIRKGSPFQSKKCKGERHGCSVKINYFAIRILDIKNPFIDIKNLFIEG